MTRFAIVSPDQSFERRFREAFGGPGGDVRSLCEPEVRAMLEESADEDGSALQVVLLGPALPLDLAVSLAEGFDRKRPEVSVVLVAEPDAAVCAEALRVGVRDVLSPDSGVADIQEVIGRASRTAEGRQRAVAAKAPAPAVSERPGRIITVASPKGGSGKTTVATNLAVGLGRAAPGEVVIVDLDLDFGDVASSLHLDPDQSVIDAVGALAQGDDMVLKTFLDAHGSGCYALCAPGLPGDGAQVGAEHVQRLLERLAAGFRYVIVDTAAGLDEHTLTALEHSTDALMVTGMDVPGVRGMRKELDVLDELGLSGPQRTVVLNFVDKHSGLTVTDIESMLGVTVGRAVARSHAVPLSTNRGVPLLEEGSRDAAARELRALVKAVAPAEPDGRPGFRERRRERAASTAAEQAKRRESPAPRHARRSRLSRPRVAAAAPAATGAQ